MKEYVGRAAIGHVRYATCGAEDRSYAQPFERHHIKKHKWFSFAFNGQLANYSVLRDELLGDSDNYLARETDTEIFMHMISKALSQDGRPPLIDLCRQIADRRRRLQPRLLNAWATCSSPGPARHQALSYAVDGPLFAAASESVRG